MRLISLNLKALGERALKRNVPPSVIGLFTCVIVFSGIIGCSVLSMSSHEVQVLRRQAVLGTRATFCRPPRKADGRVDTDRLVAELVDLQANSYCFCISDRETDWDDLKLVLPAANARNIRIWASLPPPLESLPRAKNSPEPFRLDYVRWATEFATLSLEQPNLVAWSIDDFSEHLKQPFTPAYLKRMLDAAHVINPRLAFVPCCYYPAMTAQFVTSYIPLLDGILYPYRHESEGANLKDPSLADSELKRLKGMLGPDFPVVLDIYATAHSKLGDTTAEYVELVMISGHRVADGVMIYRHQDPVANSEKYQIVRRLFTSWAQEH